MTLPADLLDLPVRRGCRVVALSMLERAAEAQGRIGVSGDSEALHDFRVAVRRLRSWVRAFRPWIRESVPRGMRRRLRRLAAATGASRDAEVHLEWIASQLPHLTPRQRSGARWFQRRLLAAKKRSDAELQTIVAARFARVHGSLERDLGEYTVRVSVHGTHVEPRFAAVMAGLIREHASVLREYLSTIGGYHFEEQAHRSRIAGKRLRYLLEPLSDYEPGVQPMVERLKLLQDGLGDVHDAHVFAAELTAAMEAAAAGQATAPQSSTPPEDGKRGRARHSGARDPRPGLEALARLLQQRGEQAYALIEREWLSGAAEPFFAEVEAIAATLEARIPAGHEIERKYLLRALPGRAPQGENVDIRQGYLPGERVIERLRHVRNSGKEHWVRTVKSGTGMSRLEVEEETTRELFEALWPLTQGRRLTKRRYTVCDGGRKWEIDEFTDRDLVLAEVELPSEDATVEIPGWLAEYVVREVTSEPDFVNVNLAR